LQFGDTLPARVRGGIGRADSPRQEQPMKVRVHVSLKPGVLDPQGRAVHHALDGLGFAGVEDVRVGRTVELDVAEGTSDADLKAMCEKLLANTVIENYRIEKEAA
jgi:phosphoribosylformylglycinamidine synthase